MKEEKSSKRKILSPASDSPIIRDVKKIEVFGQLYDVNQEYMDFTTIEVLKGHLPEMEKGLFTQLLENIRINGIVDPIMFIRTPQNDKLVIEGHTRLQAAIDLSLDNFPSKEVTGEFTSMEDVKLWMIKHQFQRRNLSNVEKVQLAYLGKETIEKKARENLSKAGKEEKVDVPVDTNEEIAKLAGVSRTTVVRYTSVMDNGQEAIKSKMLKGEVSISSAEKLVKAALKRKAKIIQTKTEPSSENEIDPKLRMITSLQEGQELLIAGEIKSLVLIANNEHLNLFTREQKESFGFLIIES